jgi:hypothetical protein
MYRFWLALDSALTQTVEETPVDTEYPSWQVPASTLDYDTVYFWGVMAIEPTESPLSIGTFTTMAEPVEVVPLEAPPTPAYIWAIIVIGAVLMIAVLMLIVKTRRVV